MRNDVGITQDLLNFKVVADTAVQMIEVKERGEQVIRRDMLVREHGLNDRQRKILDLLFRKGTVHITELEDICPGVTRRTLQRDLNNLIEFDLVRL